MAIDKTTLGKAIRQVRNLRGMSQVALAEEAGIQGNSLALIERGQRGVSMDTLNELAGALNVPAACLAMLGSKKIAGSNESAAFVKSLQKLISATIVAQVTIEAEEDAERAKRDHISDAMQSIPEIEEVLRKLSAKGKKKSSGKKKARAPAKKKVPRKLETA
jgi:transcriptional regulator with XRE-family HTH domain